MTEPATTMAVTKDNYYFSNRGPGYSAAAGVKGAQARTRVAHAQMPCPKCHRNFSVIGIARHLRKCDGQVEPHTRANNNHCLCGRLKATPARACFRCSGGWLESDDKDFGLTERLDNENDGFRR